MTRRDTLWESVRRLSALVPFKPSGAFYLWARITDAWQGYGGQTGGWAMTNMLIDSAGVGSAPGEAFGDAGAGHIRFAFSCPTDQVVKAAAVLKQVLGQEHGVPGPCGVS